MKSTFEVSRAFGDGTETEALIVPVTALPADAQMALRVFFRAGMTLFGVAAVLAGCGSPGRTAATATNDSSSDPQAAAPPTTTASEPTKAPATPQPRVAKKSAPRRPRPRPKPPSDTDDSYSGVPSYRSVPSYRPYGGYTGGGTRLGETIERPCTPEPVPPGYICTCNCVAR